MQSRDGILVDATPVVRSFLAADGLDSIDETRSVREVTRRIRASVAALEGIDLDQLLERVQDAARRQRFASLRWRFRAIRLNSIGAWPGMGGLPLTWTAGPITDTARLVEERGCPTNAARLRQLVAWRRRAPAAALAFCEALPLIAVREGILNETLREKVTYCLDDGSHRALILALAGVDVVRTYVGQRAS